MKEEIFTVKQQYPVMKNDWTFELKTAKYEVIRRWYYKDEYRLKEN